MGFLLRHPGIGAVVVADIAVIHPSSLPSGQELLSQVEQPGQLEGPLHLILLFLFQIGPQGIEQRAGVAVPLTAQLLNQGQEPGEELGVHSPGQGGEGGEQVPAATWRWRGRRRLW